MSKELEEKVLSAIEVAKTTGKIRKGTNEVTKALETGKAKLVAIAKNVTPPEIVIHIPILSKEKGVKCVTVENKTDLGAAAGLPIGTSAVVVTEEGDSKDKIKEINESKEE